MDFASGVRSDRRCSKPRATHARYDARNERILVEMMNACVFAFPPALTQGLVGSTPKALGRIEVTPKGTGLHLPLLDADLSVPDLVAGIFGSSAWRRERGRRGAAVSSSAKATAARGNGRKGAPPAASTTKRRMPVAA